MDMITYESPVYREVNPRDCKMCNLHVKRAMAPCWDIYGVCPVCFNKSGFERNNTPSVQDDTIVIHKNPFDFYLDNYTHTELENVS